MSLFQHSATDNRAFAKVLSLFEMPLPDNRLNEGKTATKSPALALTSAHHWVFFLSSVLQSCKHDASFLKSH